MQDSDCDGLPDDSTDLTSPQAGCDPNLCIDPYSVCTGGVNEYCIDNCPDTCNSQQLDADDDIGDVCDSDPGCGGCGQDPCEEPC